MSYDVSNAAEMRLQLQRVVAYRDLCRTISRSGRENIVWAAIMFGLAYYVNDPTYWLIVGVLAGAELFAGLFKWLWPCAEGFLIDGLVLLMFAVWNGYRAYDLFQRFGVINPVSIFFGIYLFYHAINRFKAYRQLLRLFSNRPTSAHLAWFDDLVREIRTADPQTDESALDLPTRPHWKAKLLGSTAFFVPLRGTAVFITSPDEFHIVREKDESGTGTRQAILFLHNRAFPVFDIDDATWENFEKWQSVYANSGR